MRQTLASVLIHTRTCTEGGMDIEIILPGNLFSDIPSNPSILSS
jgi:hypothetical protein